MKDTRDKQAQGVHARNQAFRHYEQVNKPQDYHLAEQPGEEEFDETYEIRTCDMSQVGRGDRDADRAFDQQLGAALQGIGFAILTGHGIDPKLYREAARLTRTLFEKTTETQRLSYLARRHGAVNQGYFPMRETSLIHPDLVQGWVFCRRAFDLQAQDNFDASEFWPLAHLEPPFRQLVSAQEQLVLPVMRSLLRYLGVDEHLYDDKLTKPDFGFRLNYYPPLEAQQDAAAGGRMLGHEDVDLFTFLPAPEVEGLQVLNRRNMKWIRLAAPPGSIIINTGDYMQRISNDVFPSTTHRVSQPVDPANRVKPRVSFPMAIYLREQEWLEVLPGLGPARYPPIQAIQFHTAITSKYYGDDYAVISIPDGSP